MPDMESVISGALSSYKESAGITDDADSGVDPGDTTEFDNPEPAEQEEAAETPETPETPEAEETPAAEVPETPEAEKPVVPADDGELGPEKDKYGRVNRIPHTRVKAIVAKATAALEATFKTEREAHTAKIAENDKRFKEIDNVERLMFDEHDTFLGILENIPGYKEKLAAKYGAATAAGTSAAAAADTDPMPKPDTEGGYSEAGLAKLFEWNGRQVEKRINERYQPLVEERDSDKRRKAQDARISAVKAEYYTWEGARENEAAVAAAMAADGRLSLEGAYRKVVLPKLKTDEAKIRSEERARVIAELKKAPASTGTAPAPARKAAAAPSGPRDMTDVIREAIHGRK